MNAALEPQADPYSVLNVRRDASDEEIKRAYKYVQAPAANLSFSHAASVPAAPLS
jgi:hypothetical protein